MVASWSSGIQNASLFLYHHPQTMASSLRAALLPRMPDGAPAITPAFQMGDGRKTEEYIGVYVSATSSFFMELSWRAHMMLPACIL